MLHRPGLRPRPTFVYEKALVYYARAETFDLKKLDDLNVTSTFYDVNGEELGRIFVEDRIVLKPEEIPRHDAPGGHGGGGPPLLRARRDRLLGHPARAARESVASNRTACRAAARSSSSWPSI